MSFIDWYNHHRRHTRLDNQSPIRVSFSRRGWTHRTNPRRDTRLWRWRPFDAPRTSVNVGSAPLLRLVSKRRSRTVLLGAIVILGIVEAVVIVGSPRTAVVILAAFTLLTILLAKSAMEAILAARDLAATKADAVARQRDRAQTQVEQLRVALKTTRADLRATLSKLDTAQGDASEARYRMRALLLPSPIIVHQMGKVGSMSIERAIRARLPDRAVFHTHRLNPDWLSLEPSGVGLNRHLAARISRDGFQGFQLVTPIREPIGRNIFALFENFDEFFDGDAENISASEAIATFVERYSHGVPLTWFDQEAKAVFGIDVYETPFDHERGYSICAGQGVSLLVLRIEDFDWAVAPALSEFLGVDDITLERTHVGVAGENGELYKEVLETISVPQHLLDQAYGSRYARHFYTESELDQLRSKWAR